MLQKVKNHLKEQKGFTLIELLAVIVILGIIAAIAIPAISNIIDNSKKDAEVSDALMAISAAKLANSAGVEAVDISATAPVTSGVTVTTEMGWTQTTLDEYLENTSGFKGVIIQDGEYYIVDHVGLLKEFPDTTSDPEVLSGEAISEAQLLAGRASM